MVVECSIANCNIDAHVCYPDHCLERSSVCTSFSHFQNWRIFGFTRDAISSSIPLLGYYYQADFFRLLFGSMRASARTVLRGDVDQALEDDVDQALIVMTKPSKMMSTRPW